MIKLILADDHKMFRQSLSKILTLEKIGEVLAEASNGFELIELLDHFKPDIILMDISMPNMDGIDATKKAMQKQPSVKVITLSSFGEEKYYFSMIEAGAKGFVLKNAGIEELQNAIIEVANGGSWFTPSLLQSVIQRLSSRPKKFVHSELTEREIEVLRLICESLTNEQIADKINLSYDTVKWHRANILSKTGSSNTAGLVIFAIKNKIIEI
jgi:DNA-binding NarL/FixJ family response regulator